MPKLGKLTPQEMSMLAATVEWVECPLCEGKAVTYVGSSTFCTLCQQTGRVLSGTRSVTSWLIVDYKAMARKLETIEQDHAEAMRQLAQVIDDPDQRLCCNGRECGCHGATVGQFAAWLMNENGGATTGEVQ